MNFEELWRTTPSPGRPFAPGDAAALPPAARRYLEHAIAPATPLAAAVRLRMRGEIRLRQWLPFRAEEVIAWGRGMIWRASVSMHGLPLRGADQWLGSEGGEAGEGRAGAGAMHWRLFGIVPVIRAAGADITRSAAGRVNSEVVWLPSALVSMPARWTEADGVLHARFTAHGEPADLALAIAPDGRLQSLALERWGNPDGAGWRSVSFGATFEAERTFAGYTIPSRLRAGWYFGSERFAAEGEFFRAELTAAEFR